MKRPAGLARLHLGRFAPALELDLPDRLKILQMIAQPIAFYGKELDIREARDAA